MDTPKQETPYQKLTKPGCMPPPSISPHKKSRSNSINADLDNEQKSSNDEPAPPSPTEKLDFAEIRKKFESQGVLKISKPYVYNKRPSMPVATNITTFTSSSTKSHDILTSEIVQIKGPTMPRTLYVRPQQIVKSKSPLSSSPPLSDETNITLKQNISCIPMNHIQNLKKKLSIEEHDNSYSPLPNSDDSSIPSENDNDNERLKSVQKMRNFFNQQHNVHVNQPIPSHHRNSLPANKLALPGLIQNSRQPLGCVPPNLEKYLKSQLYASESFPSADTTDSITGDSSLSSNQNLSLGNSSDVSFSDEEDVDTEKRTKLRKCVEEVHATEKTYVNILYVLSVKLSAEIKNTCDKDDNLVLTFNSTYKPLLGNIQQIYQLHHDIISPEMEEYITGHSTGSIWSVLERNFKVIEVLYKHYYVTYYDTQGKLDDLCKTYPLINEAMLKCQVHLGNLYPITQLNCPNQRLLRYILCMKTYMKYLNEHSAEYKHTRSIHDELDRIAMRCEEELVISAAQLNDLKERLDNKFECIKDHRKLLWHGSLKKQSPRKHSDIAQRYMILFSDCILVCSEDSGRKLDMKRELSMRAISVDVVEGGRTVMTQNGDQQSNGITYYPFRVNAVEKSYEFLADKESDREIWVKKIRQASEDYNKRNTMIEIRQLDNYTDEQQLGIRAPAWVNDVDVTRCQNCNNRFRTTLISSRRHHCRSCGRCVCGSCSTKKLSLAYCQNEGEVRVCDACYTHFTGTVLSKNTSIWPKPTREVDETILFGDFRTINSGTNVWIALQEDYQLHIYGAKLDQAEEYSIKLPDLIELQLESETRIFTLRETTKTHTFTIESNHQITYPKNDLTEEKMKNSDNKLIFYANLWLEAMQLARSTTLPDWYIRKRDSADSGVSNVN